MFLEELEYIVLDFETTGLNPEEGEGICEIGALQIKGRKIIGTFSQLVKPRKPIPSLVSSLTGITDSMVKTAPYFDEIVHDFLGFIGNRPIFAYNVKFDISFLNAELDNCRRQRINNVLIDILFICRKLFYGQLGKFSLKEVAGFLNIDTSNLHRALADAKIAAEVLQRTAEFLTKRGVDNWDVFLALFSPLNYYPLWQKDYLALLHSAIKDKSPLYIKYFSYNSLNFLDLEILPLKLEERSGRNYLVGRYLGKNEDRVFNVSRITKLSLRKR